MAYLFILRSLEKSRVNSPSGSLNHWKLRTWRSSGIFVGDLRISTFLEMTKSTNSVRGLCQEPTVQLTSMLLISAENLLCLIWFHIQMSYRCHTDVIQMSYRCLLLVSSNWLLDLMILMDAYDNLAPFPLAYFLHRRRQLHRAENAPRCPGETHSFDLVPWGRWARRSIHRVVGNLWKHHETSADQIRNLIVF